jgi:RNA polymerase sigma factor (sigma-70 family)
MHGLPPNALVEKHLWIVDRFASTYARAAPNADLKAAGALGLVEAAQRFKPRKGVQFSTYAWNWVKGAVLSELRRCHVVPVPEHTARAAHKAGEPVRGVVVFNAPEPGESDAQEERADQAMRSRALHLAISRLPPKQRQVISRTLAGRTIEQIARGMRLTETRVSELLAQAREELTWQIDG